MQFEYLALTIMTIIFLFAWLPASVAKYQSFGRKWLASNRDPIPGKELSSWGQRAERAHSNLKDYFPAFAVAVLLLGHTAKFDQSTAWASGLYVIGRFFHFYAYLIGHVNFRFLSYLLALASNIYLLAKLCL